MIHPTHTFSPTDTALLSTAGYCIGYNLDGTPERAMAVHPKTGFIVRSFWNGCSIWHPSANRTSEKVGSDMATILGYTSDLKSCNQYSHWHRYPDHRRKLANLKGMMRSENNQNNQPSA